MSRPIEDAEGSRLARHSSQAEAEEQARNATYGEPTRKLHEGYIDAGKWVWRGKLRGHAPGEVYDCNGVWRTGTTCLKLEQTANAKKTQQWHVVLRTWLRAHHKKDAVRASGYLVHLVELGHDVSREQFWKYIHSLRNRGFLVREELYYYKVIELPPV